LFQRHILIFANSGQGQAVPFSVLGKLKRREM